MPSVPILTYHSLDDHGSVISVSPAAFRAHMLHLRDRGFQGLPLGDLLDAWEGKRELPPRPVVLTFDDGFRNLIEHAAGPLADLGFRATVFAVAGYCGGKNDWPTQPRDVPRLSLCSWSDLRELASAGWEVGSHGLTHAPLDGQAGDMEGEVAGSKARIEDGLGLPVTVFAYPYGVTGPAARALVARHYRAACTARMGRADREDDRHALPRIDAYYLRGPRMFRLFGTPGGEAYLGLRALGRACRSWLGPRRYPGGADG